MDFKAMAASLGVDEEDFMELLDLLVTTSFSDLETLEQGLRAGDAARVAGAAHSIKGAAGNMGFMDISGLAASIEASARAGDLGGLESSAAGVRQELGRLGQILGR